MNRLRILLCAVVGMTSLAAQKSNQLSDFQRGIADILRVADHLTLAPKAVATNDGSSTAGVEYSYVRPIHNFVGGTELDLYVESRGTFVADPDLTPETRLSHNLRLTAIDILASTQQQEWVTRRGPDGVTWRRRAVLPSKYKRTLDGLHTEWGSEPPGPERDKKLAELKALWAEQEDLPLTVDETNNRVEEIAALFEPRPKRLPFLSVDLAVGAETNQEFTRNQWTGGVALRGKWDVLATPFDCLLATIRGYGDDEIVDYRNFDRGTYFWGGVDLVDASDDEARTAITDDEQFARLNVGAFYRGELYSVRVDGVKHGVALELEWRYYFEIDAPAPVDAADQESMSWFRGTLVFPGNTFLEYTDGMQPLDLTEGSRLFVGWRHNF
jgi:hypothetical protein